MTILKRITNLLRRSKKIKRRVLVGELTALQIVEAQNQWFEDPGFDPKIPVLWDLRQAKLPTETEWLSVVPRGILTRSNRARPDGLACALVSGIDDQRILETVYEEQIRAGRIKITTEEEIALRWLAQSE